MGRAPAAVLLVVALAACRGDDGDTAERTASPVVEEIRAAIADEAGTERFATDPVGGDGRIVCLDGEPIRLHVFASEGERRAAEARIDPADPSNVGNAIVSWVGTPRLWADGVAIVLYTGADESLVADLTDSLGPPFAAGRGRAVMPELPC